VVPAKDEAACLPQLVEEIAGSLRPLCGHTAGGGAEVGLSGFEILIVDDGSTDRTGQVLEELAREYPELRPLRLRSNVGQSAAIAAGMDAARGDWIATLDADLQNDPADLATLWEVLPGHDVALGWRVRRMDAWSRRAISRLANAVRNAVLGQAIRDTGCSVRIFPRDVALRLPCFHGMHRFFGPLLLRDGCRVVQVPVNHRPRPHGRSHYNFRNRSLRVVVDLIGVAWLMRRRVRYELVGARGRGALPPPPSGGARLQTSGTAARGLDP
jgi:glycosyltransferase involved in cell wall biosynthesis